MKWTRLKMDLNKRLKLNDYFSLELGILIGVITSIVFIMSWPFILLASIIYILFKLQSSGE